ncbi:methyltransferase domain-containing protein [Halobacillus trueperi]|uniref:Methyltransferase domain-containing protein n=1 Tax=Halobacillus trueperi TaxID=156205 RepID=A0A3D8VRW9_9BACI|nr:methyltransferase domain-containing protein [Halobacillus trueperi]RDY71528.1 methyltransferase domain-containing protein [Halobacillus trueperi]
MIENTIIKIVGEQLNLYAGYISEETRMENICEDVVDIYQIKLAIEDEIEIDLSSIDIHSTSTIGDLIKDIKENYKFTNYKYPLFERKLKKGYRVEGSTENLSDVEKMHYNFAISTVTRGINTINKINPSIDLYNKSCLDVGCAYGGFLVAFKQSGATRAVGIDINNYLLDLCQSLIKDTHIDAEIYKKNILNFDEVGRLGSFDFITCNDVIEHVKEPDIAIRNMATLLKSGGTIYFQIPNRLSVNFIKSDGHFKLPGITILPKEKADLYYNEIFPEGYHDVTYKSLIYYIDHLNRLGLRCDILNPELKNTNKEEILLKIRHDFIRCNESLQNVNVDINQALKDQIILRSNSLFNLFEDQLNDYFVEKDREPQKAEDIATKLILTFGVDFWEITATDVTEANLI